MIEYDREIKFPLVRKSEWLDIQWQWLPLLFIYSAIWFYGLYCLVSKVL
jgi:hypothetical protein